MWQKGTYERMLIFCDFAWILLLDYELKYILFLMGSNGLDRVTHWF